MQRQAKSTGPQVGSFSKNVLIYSDYCTYCQNFASVLIKHPDILDQFEKINIDIDLSTKQRPQMFYDIQRTLDFEISEVPTIVVESGNYVLTGEEAFKWLDYQIKQKEAQDTLQAFNPMEMGSFSDSYSNYGATDDSCALQSFKFLCDPDTPIQTPQELNTDSPQKIDFTKGSINNKQRDIDKRLQELIGEREGMMNKGPRNSKHRIDFTTGKMA
ncbi:hypothetical protein EBU95_02310 [bacterium]|nr:hypothetical protein [bacterium]